MNTTENLKNSMHGRWPEFIRMLSGIDESVFNGKHQPCPCCGGRDRFRYIIEDGGAICSQCGGGDGIEWAKKISGLSYREIFIEIRSFLGLITRSNNFHPAQAAGRTITKKHTAEVTRNKVVELLEKCRAADDHPWILFNNLDPKKFRQITRKSQRYVVVPIRKIIKFPDEFQTCNAALIDECGEVEFLAGRPDFERGMSTAGGVVVVGQQITDTIYVCVDIADAHRINAMTKKTCFCLPSREIHRDLNNSYQFELDSSIAIERFSEMFYDEIKAKKMIFVSGDDVRDSWQGLHAIDCGFSVIYPNDRCASIQDAQERNGLNLIDLYNKESLKS